MEKNNVGAATSQYKRYVYFHMKNINHITLSKRLQYTSKSQLKGVLRIHGSRKIIKQQQNALKIGVFPKR